MDNDERNEEMTTEEPQSMLMRLIARAKRKMEEKAQADPDFPEQDEARLGSKPEKRFDSVADSVGLESAAKAPSAAAPPKQAEPEKMGKNNHLLMLKQKTYGLPMDADENVPYSEFIYACGEPDGDQRRALQSMQRIAQQSLQAIAAQEAIIQRQTAPDAPPEPPQPIDTRFYLHVSGNRMQAWGFLTAPMNGGEDVTQELLLEQLEHQKVVFGINQEILKEIVREKLYFVLIPIAQGRQPVHGRDGTIEDRFPRDVKINLQEKEDATVDYKDLHWIHSVKAGGVICDIIPPTQAISGVDVLGAAVQGRDGKQAIAPKGKNTEVTEDERYLIASVGGQVEFHHGQFHVEQLTTIQNDVDNSTGNIDVIGNVVIKGDVREGFVVKATGDIAIKGKVEGAFIIAGGSIQIGMGMNGSLSGSLEAKGDINTKYLENCTAHAGGNIRSDSIVNSNVSSDHDINITFGLGAIIGGTIMAANNLQANLIGNKSNRTTVIILGGTPGVLKEKSDTDAALKQMRADIEEVQKNLQYLGRSNSLIPEHKRLQNELKLKLTTLNLQQAKLRSRRDELLDTLDPSNCRLASKTIYPITQITIGNATRIVREQMLHCNVFYSDGEVAIGTK